MPHDRVCEMGRGNIGGKRTVAMVTATWLLYSPVQDANDESSCLDFDES